MAKPPSYQPPTDTTSQLAKDLFELDSLDGPGMEKLHAEFCTARPSDDCTVDPEDGGRVADFHAEKQEFTGTERLGAPDAAAVDGQVKNRPGRRPCHTGQRSRKLYGDSGLLASIILKVVQRRAPVEVTERRNAKNRVSARYYLEF